MPLRRVSFLRWHNVALLGSGLIRSLVYNELGELVGVAGALGSTHAGNMVCPGSRG